MLKNRSAIVRTVFLYIFVKETNKISYKNGTFSKRNRNEIRVFKK